ALNRRDEIVQAVLGHGRRNFRADAAVARGLVHDDEPAGFRDGVEDRIEIDRAHGRKIDDLGADVLRCELVRGLQSVDDHRAPGDERDVLALAQDVAHIERQRRAVVGDLLFRIPIYTCGLEEYDRIRVADRGEQQAVGTRGRRRTYDANSGDVRDHRFDRLGVMLGRVDTAAVRYAQHDGAAHASTGAMAQAAHVIDDLIDRGIQKAHELNFRDRPHALRRHTDAHAGDHVLRERRVLHAFAAEPLEQALGRAKHAAALAYIFAEHDDAFIVGELPRLRHRNRLDHGDFRHG